MKNWADSDPSLKVGDLVFSNYHKNEMLYRIIKIEQRFLLDDLDVKSHQGVYPGCQIGDEYNPIVTIETVANLSIKADFNKKLRKNIKELDASWLIKISSERISEHIKRVNDLLVKFYS